MDPITTDLQPLLHYLIESDTTKNEQALRCFSDLLEKMRITFAPSDLQIRSDLRSCIPHITQAFERVLRRLHKISSVDVQFLVYENIERLAEFVGPLHAKGLYQLMEKSHSLELAREQNERLRKNDMHRAKYLRALLALFHVALPFADISKDTVEFIWDGIPSLESLHWIYVMLANQLPQVSDMISRLYLFTESTQLRALTPDQHTAIKELLCNTAIVLYGSPNAALKEYHSEDPMAFESEQKRTESASDTHLQDSDDEEIPSIVLDDDG